METLTAFGMFWKVDKSMISILVDFFRPLISFYSRELFFMSHVPWLSSITFFVPGFLKNLKAFRANGKDCARRRVKEGSTRKDLFYHLVRCVFQSIISSHNNIFFRLTRITLLLSSQPYPRL